MKRATILWGLAALLLAGCADEAPPAGERGVPARTSSAEQLELGRTLFVQHCAACHGERAQGDPSWRYRGPDGMFPPPPLNGTAHAWHHPYRELHDIIKYGSTPGLGNMPAWQGVLDDAQIDAVIAWFQSLWPDEVYAAWYDIDQRERRRAAHSQGEHR